MRVVDVKSAMRRGDHNTIALVLIVAALLQLERWNRDGRLRDALIGSVAMALVIGYSVTLVFPLVAAVFLWMLAGRIRRPLVVVALAAVLPSRARPTPRTPPGPAARGRS